MKPSPLFKLSALLVSATLLWGCETNPPAPPPQRPAALSDDALLEQGVQFAVDDLLAQAARSPAFQEPPKTGLENLLKSQMEALLKPDAAKAKPKPVLVVDATIDGASGQQSAGTRTVDDRLVARLKEKLSTHDVAAVDSSNIKSAAFVVTGTLTQLQQGSTRGGFRLNVSLTDLRSGFVIGQAVARVQSNGVDETPTRFYRESPVTSKDRAVEGQIKTAQMPVGNEADGVYLSRLPIAALIAEGDRQYESGNCDDALRFFEAAAARPEGKQLRVLNAVYLCQSQLGRAEASEAAFGRIVALGLVTNNLSVKFLFKPGSTDFLADPKVTASYAMWLRQIAREASNAKVCMQVIGHTSKTGADVVNDRLSLQRAVAVQRRLESSASDLQGKLQPLGMGFRENIVGSGTDDMRDALDRRVEFKTRPC